MSIIHKVLKKEIGEIEKSSHKINLRKKDYNKGSGGYKDNKLEDSRRINYAFGSASNNHGKSLVSKKNTDDIANLQRKHGSFKMGSSVKKKYKDD